MHWFVWPLLFILGSSTAAQATDFHLNTPQLAAGTVGRTYAGAPLLLQGGGECPRNTPVVRVVAGALPGGMYLTSGGQFGGAPLEPGRYEFVVRVENGCGWSDQTMLLEVTGAPILLANPASLEFRIAQGQTLTPAAIQVSGSAAGWAYTVETTAPWLQARARAGRTPVAGAALSADFVEVEIASASLAPGQHRAEIVIGGWRLAQPVIVPVRVDVLGAGMMPGASAGLDPRLPRIQLGAPELAGVHPAEPAPVATHALGPAPGEPAHATAAVPAAKPARPAAMPGRMSRSAQLRSKYLASKKASPAPAPPAAAAPAAQPPDKPSPVGEPVKKAEAAAPAKPADAHAKPADVHAKPADAHAKPAADAHAKPKEVTKH